MGIPVFMSVTEFFHQSGRSIAQVNGHFTAGILFHKGSGLVVSHISGIALGGDGHVDDSLRQCQFTFRTAEAFIRQGGFVGDLRRSGISQPDVFPCHANDPACQIAGIDTTVEHAGEPVQRSIRMGTAYRLVQGRYLVVKMIALVVETAHGVAQCLFQERHIDYSLFFRRCRLSGDFKVVQQFSGVPVGTHHQHVTRFTG